MLILSAILTAVYMFTVVIPAWFMPLNDDAASLSGHSADPGPCIIVPLCVLTLAIVVFGLASTPLVRFLRLVGEGAL